MMQTQNKRAATHIEKWFTTISRKAPAGFSALLAIAVLFISSAVSAQEVSATLKADSSHILIGDFLNVKLTIRSSSDVTVTMPTVADTVGNLELVKASKIDTAVDGNFKTLTQTFTVSAYDSGNYHAGPLRVLFKTKNGISDTLLSDSVLITVATLPVDTSKAFKAIKNPIEVPYTLAEFVPVLGGGILLVAILIAIIYYIRQRRKNRKPKIIERPKPKDPPHVWARRELKKLEEEKLWQKDEIKNYYSRLTDILRLYLEYRYNWFALESTTEKIKEDIDAYKIEAEAKQNLLTVLNEGDLVKFAKHIPMPDSNVKMMEKAYRLIDLTEAKAVVEDVK